MAKLKEVNNDIKALYRKLMRDTFNRSDVGTQTSLNIPMLALGAGGKEITMVDKGMQTVYSPQSPIQSPKIRIRQSFDEENSYPKEINDENTINYGPKERNVTEKIHQSSLFHQRTPRKKVAINYKGKILIIYFAVV